MISDDIVLSFDTNIDCIDSLKPSRKGSFNMDLQPMFLIQK